MTFSAAQKLKSKDKVWWEDPDAGFGSRYIEIKQITFHGNLIRIIDMDDNYLECFAYELRKC